MVEGIEMPFNWRVESILKYKRSGIQKRRGNPCYPVKVLLVNHETLKTTINEHLIKKFSMFMRHFLKDAHYKFEFIFWVSDWLQGFRFLTLHLSAVSIPGVDKALDARTFSANLLVVVIEPVLI